ncbi:hypothetical protein ACWDUL_20825 [Nocardia niigatensis]
MSSEQGDHNKPESGQPPARALTGYELAWKEADGIAAAAGPGWRVHPDPQPPYGWQLIDPAGVVRASGDLRRLTLWVKGDTTTPTDDSSTFEEPHEHHPETTTATGAHAHPARTPNVAPRDRP